MDILEILDREGLRIAPDDKRLSAFFIDEMIISLILFVGFYKQIADFNGNAKQILEFISNLFLYIIILKIIYHSVFTAIYGASIGKIICKIKIIKIDTLDKPNIMTSIIRSSLRTLSEILLYIPLMIAFADPFRRTLGDLLVESIVIDVSIPQDIQD